LLIIKSFFSINKITNSILDYFKIYWSCVITRCAETGCVLPANGVIVSAVELSDGFLTVKTELIVVVVKIANPII